MACEQSGDHGKMTLPSGKHERHIYLRYRPKRVYVSIEDDNTHLVGKANLSSVSISYRERGFILFADIQNTALVNWLAY